MIREFDEYDVSEALEIGAAVREAKCNHEDAVISLGTFAAYCELDRFFRGCFYALLFAVPFDGAVIWAIIKVWRMM